MILVLYVCWIVIVGASSPTTTTLVLEPTATDLSCLTAPSGSAADCADGPIGVASSPLAP